MLSEIRKLVCCPDDGAEVIVKNNYLECTSCHRDFPMFANNMVEMLPSAFPQWNLLKDENNKAEESYKNMAILENLCIRNNIKT